MVSFIVGIIAGILCTASFIPQVVKIVKTRQTGDLSLVAFATLALGVSLWLIYGILIGAVPVIIANVATLILVCVIVIMKIRWG